jgi:16S rRNA (cytidine1402-2'-O)-methyltransferase
VIYEAPHRIRDTLSDLLDSLGDRQILLARELTKLHETLVVRPISEFLGSAAIERGEYTIVVSPPDASSQLPIEASDSDIYTEFGLLTNNESCSRREAIQALAARFGLSPKEVYRRIEAVKQAGK